MRNHDRVCVLFRVIPNNSASFNKNAMETAV
jgi:hypothetical protein